MTSSITARSAGTWIHLMRRRFCGKWRRILKRQKEYSEFKFATDDLMAQVMEARPELLDKASLAILQLLRTRVRKIYIQRGYGDKKADGILAI